MTAYKDEETKLEKVLFKDSIAGALVEKGDYEDALNILFNRQMEDWPLLRKNSGSNNQIKYKRIDFENFHFNLQYNPNRIISSTAKTDKDSISKRKCFLCYSYLPDEQKAILYGSDYLIICNPYPIFDRHLTVPNINHFPQAIIGQFNTMLNMSRDLSEHYNIFYNGPQCGASAPDHLHFQAGNKNFLPIDSDLEIIRNLYGEALTGPGTISVTAIDDGLRRFIVIESKEAKLVKKTFDDLYEILSIISKSGNEPLLNIISAYADATGWRILVFPRQKHRPSHYYLNEESRILFSPGVADMGGVCIIPREMDFDRFNKELLSDIFREIVIGKESFEFVKLSLMRKLI